MADALEQDVHALKEWLRGAWRHLAEPSINRFDRRELRAQMRQASAELRAAFKSSRIKGIPGQSQDS